MTGFNPFQFFSTEEKTTPSTPPTTPATTPPTNDANNTAAPENNVDEFATLWDTPKSSEQSASQPDATLPTGQPGAPNTQQQEPSQVDKYLENLNFVPTNLNTQELAEQLREGDLAGLTSLINGTSKQAFIQAVTATNQLMEHKISAAVETAVTQAQSAVGADLHTLAMFRELPYTQDAAIQPIAASVLSQFINKGKSVQESIQLTDKFFKKTGQAVGYVDPSTLNGPGSGAMRPGAGPSPNFTPAGSTKRNAGQDDMDWTEVLAAKPPTSTQQ